MFKSVFDLIMCSIADYVGWAQVHHLFTKTYTPKPVFVSLLAQTKLPIKISSMHLY